MRRVALTAMVLGLGACGAGSGQIQKLVVTSSAFGPSGTIPKQYTCDGRNTSPPLHWSNVPDNATELRLIMHDPDAPGGNFIHWQLSELSPEELATHSELLDEDFYAVLRDRAWLEDKVSRGGTSLARVREQLDRARSVLQ